MAKTPQMNLHSRGSGDVETLKFAAEKKYIAALGAGLLRAMNPADGVSYTATDYHIPSLGVTVGIEQAEMIASQLPFTHTQNEYATLVKEAMTPQGKIGKLALVA